MVLTGLAFVVHLGVVLEVLVEGEPRQPGFEGDDALGQGAEGAVDLDQLSFHGFIGVLGEGDVLLEGAELVVQGGEVGREGVGMVAALGHVRGL